MAILLLEKTLAKNAAATKATKYKGIGIWERESENLFTSDKGQISFLVA